MTRQVLAVSIVLALLGSALYAALGIVGQYAQDSFIAEMNNSGAVYAQEQELTQRPLETYVVIVNPYGPSDVQDQIVNGRLMPPPPGSKPCTIAIIVDRLYKPFFNSEIGSGHHDGWVRLHYGQLVATYMVRDYVCPTAGGTTWRLVSIRTQFIFLPIAGKSWQRH